MWLFKKKEAEIKKKEEIKKEPSFPVYNISEDEMKELEKNRRNFEKNMMLEIAKIKEEMKVNLMKEIEKTNINCKEKLKLHYEKSGKFPENFECSFELPFTMFSDGYYRIDDFNGFKLEDVYKEVQKISLHNITFERYEHMFFGSETFSGYKVRLNKII